MSRDFGTIRIETDRDDYTGGDIISGKVVIDLNAAVLCRGVHLQFKGEETTYWTTGSGKSRTTHTETINRGEYNQLLFGKEALGTMAVMADAVKGIFSKSHYETFEAGHYEYDFSFSLMSQAPGDYESGDPAYYSGSRIRYEIMAYVDIPIGADLSETKMLSIFECFDLPEEESVERTAIKSFMMDSSNPLYLNVTVDNNQYYPGDVVTGKIEVDNRSSKEVTEMTVSLNQRRNMRAHRSTIERTDMKLMTTITNPVISQSVATSFDFEFKIPDDTYCTILNSRILKVNYFVNVNIDIPWAIDLDVDVPILVLEEEGLPSGSKQKK